MPTARLRLTPLEPRFTPSNSTLFAVGAGPGAAPRVQVYRHTGTPGIGETLNIQAELVADLLAFEESFRGGVSVSVGDVTGDLVADLTVGAGVGGGPRVRVFRGIPGGPTGDDAAGFDPVPVADFFAYDPAFRGGVNVATAQGAFGVGAIVGGPSPSRGYIVTAPGVGGGPHVKVFEGDPNGVDVDRPHAEFMAYDPAFRGGVSVAALGNFMWAMPRFAQDGFPEAIRVVTGAGPGGGPHVKGFDVDLVGGGVTPLPGYDNMAFDPEFRGGVTVGLRVRSQASDSSLRLLYLTGIDVLATATTGGPTEVRMFTTDSGGRLVPSGQGFAVPETADPVLATTVYPAVIRALPDEIVAAQVITNIEPPVVVAVGGDEPHLRLFNLIQPGSRIDNDGRPAPVAHEAFRLDLPDDFRGGVWIG